MSAKVPIAICSTLFLVLPLLGPKKEIAREMRTVRVAMCQILSLDGDRSGNYVRIENAIREAAEAEADIACFPETVILGWVYSDAHKRAHPISGEDSDRLCQLAARYQIYLCVGLAEKNGTKLHDSAILIDENGRILLKHRKINILSHLMTPPYTPGEEVHAVDTKLGRIGLLICADTFENEILDRTAALKLDLLLVPYGWAAPEDRWPDHGKELVKVVAKAARAVGAPVIGTNLVGEITHGPWRGQVYGGQSIASDRTGEILAVARDRDREVRIVSVTLGK